MKVYAIGGLGADFRVFEYLKIDLELISVNWISNESNESLTSYVKRLSFQIDTSKPFVLLGVSFGGIVALELGTYVTAVKTILVSSIQQNTELNYFLRKVGSTGLIKLAPKEFFILPSAIAKFLFGTKHSLLNEIIRDTPPEFVKWALQKILTWQGNYASLNVIRIHGSKDKLLNGGPADKTFWIKGGEHFMIVDKADQISEIINKELTS